MKRMSQSLQIRLAGYLPDLLLINARSSCGHIINGVGFEHQGEGTWVMDFKDLKRIYYMACAARKIKP